MHTTLNLILAARPCGQEPGDTHGWQRLLAVLGKDGPDDEPLSLLTVLNINGPDDAHWALRAVPGHAREKRLLAVAYARDVQHLMRDPRSLAALDVAERYANWLATDGELAVARDAAMTAARTAARAKQVAHFRRIFGAPHV